MEQSHSVSTEGGTSSSHRPLLVAPVSVRAVSTAISDKKETGNNRQQIRPRREKNNSQHTHSTTPRKISLEGLLLSFLVPFALWILVFSAKNAMRDIRSPSQQLRQSKSSFVDTDKPIKRMPLKNYLASLPPAVLLPQQDLLPEPKRGATHMHSTIDTKRQQQQSIIGKFNSNLNMKPLTTYQSDPSRKVVTAFLELTQQPENTKPLPVRRTKASQLQVREFPEVQHCSTFLQDFGRTVVDQFPTSDPYLPWLHDFFPAQNGTMMKFIGQNRRNCKTGVGMEDTMAFWKPQIALFQPVPVVVVPREHGDDDSTEPTFRLADNFETATARETRFICRFHNASNDAAYYTLSQFPFNYEFVSWRKHHNMLEEDSSKGSLNQSPYWVSQLLFACPIPQPFQSMVREKRHVVNDKAQLWVDVIPIRTPPRYSSQALLSHDHIGGELLKKHAQSIFDLAAEYGNNHTLPSSSDSGRWANLPICHGPAPVQKSDAKGPLHVPDNLPKVKESHHLADKPESSHENHGASTTSVETKPYRLVACTWTSASYQRRGNAVTVRDSHARLREWILFHQLVGFEHLYMYDNSPTNYEDGDNTNHDDSLEEVAREFSPDNVTYVKWPCTVCSNNRPMHKNPGDRSSQYAAEASCREVCTVQLQCFVCYCELAFKRTNTLIGSALIIRGLVLRQNG